MADKEKQTNMRVVENINKPQKETAFPVQTEYQGQNNLVIGDRGMGKTYYTAVMAMQGLIQSPAMDLKSMSIPKMAKLSFEIAHEMLKAEIENE